MKTKKSPTLVGVIHNHEKIKVELEVFRDQIHVWIIQLKTPNGWSYMDYGGITRHEARARKNTIKNIFAKLDIKLRVVKYVPQQDVQNVIDLASSMGRMNVIRCSNWNEMYIGRGQHCYNCKNRSGAPFYGQPDNNCSNWRLLRI